MQAKQELACAFRMGMSDELYSDQFELLCFTDNVRLFEQDRALIVVRTDSMVIYLIMPIVVMAGVCLWLGKVL